MSNVGDVLVPCFVCGKRLERAFDETPMQPANGVICMSSGNYGSGVLDMEEIRFVVCDGCLIERSDRVRKPVLRPYIRPETTYTGWPA